jgi:hypothetical protein
VDKREVRHSPWRRGIACGALVASALLGHATTAQADQTAAAANELAIEQGIDCVTTLAVIHAGGSERDPLAAPFVHSAVLELGSAIAVNLLMRHASIRVLHTVVAIYPMVLLGNLRSVLPSGGNAGLARR